MPDGTNITMNITTPTIVKDSPGWILGTKSFIIGNPPAGGGSIHNCNTIEAADDTNKIADFPTNGESPLTSTQIPCDLGIVVIPGNNTRVFVIHI